MEETVRGVQNHLDANMRDTRGGRNWFLTPCVVDGRAQGGWGALRRGPRVVEGHE